MDRVVSDHERRPSSGAAPSASPGRGSRDQVPPTFLTTLPFLFAFGLACSPAPPGAPVRLPSPAAATARSVARDERWGLEVSWRPLPSAIDPASVAPPLYLRREEAGEPPIFALFPAVDLAATRSPGEPVRSSDACLGVADEPHSLASRIDVSPQLVLARAPEPLVRVVRVERHVHRGEHDLLELSFVALDRGSGGLLGLASTNVELQKEGTSGALHLDQLATRRGHLVVLRRDRDQPPVVPPPELELHVDGEVRQRARSGCALLTELEVSDERVVVLTTDAMELRPAGSPRPVRFPEPYYGLRSLVAADGPEAVTVVFQRHATELVVRTDRVDFGRRTAVGEPFSVSFPP